MLENDMMNGVDSEVWKHGMGAFTMKSNSLGYSFILRTIWKYGVPTKEVMDAR
ncbi:unnamed protein product [Camellia sinensis]